MGLNGYELFLPSTLVRVSTGLLQADSGATLAECFFMMTSSDGLSSKPLRLHPWSWFGADTRPLDGTLDVSRAGLLLFVSSHPSNSLLMFFFFLPLSFPPTSFLHLPSLLKSAVPGASRLVSPHVQFGNCCNSPTSHIHQTPRPTCPEAGVPAVLPPQPSWPWYLFLGLSGRRHLSACSKTLDGIYDRYDGTNIFNVVWGRSAHRHSNCNSFWIIDLKWNELILIFIMGSGITALIVLIQGSQTPITPNTIDWVLNNFFLSFKASLRIEVKQLKCWLWS